MPLIEAGFKNQDGTTDFTRLLNFGPTIQVIVGPHVVPADGGEPKTKMVHALVDTGAFACMIDSKLAEELGLIAVDKAPVSGVGGAKDHPVFMAGIVVPQLDINQFGRFLGADLKDGGQSHEVLIGRDFLANTIMIYDGIRGQVTLASAKKK